MIFVIGGHGRLGKAIAGSYETSRLVSLERIIYQSWWGRSSKDTVARFFEPWSGSDSLVFVAAGILDPTLPEEDHRRVNYLLPRNVIEGATELGLKVVTFGTVMEKLLENKNRYVKSKAALGQYVAAISAENKRVLHLRVHTLYGTGQPSPFMFLGHVLHALVHQTVFQMTLGNQVREYHHVCDEVLAIRAVVEAGVTGVFDLNHGEQVSLGDVARHVFGVFHAEDLLRIGALPEPEEENYRTAFLRTALLEGIRFRETLPAIVDYLRECSLKLRAAE